MLEQNLFNLTEKYNVFMNIEQEDKEKFKGIVAWAGEMMEMTVKEKYSRHVHPFRAEVWTCNFGVNIGSEVNKVRPALIISDDLGNCKSPTVTVIPITSRENRQVTHVEITESDLLFIENVIKGTITTEGVRNVSKARLGRRIGKVTNECMMRVEEALKRALGFSFTSTDMANESIVQSSNEGLNDVIKNLDMSLEQVESLEHVEKMESNLPDSDEIKEEDITLSPSQSEDLPPHVLTKLKKKQKYEKRQQNQKNRKRW